MSSGQFFQWNDVFALIDDGTVAPVRYGPIETAMSEQIKRFPQGIGCLIILPPETRRPPDEVKESVKNLLLRLGPSLTCLAYSIEATGLKGVAARALLVSLRLFAARRYPVYFEASMREAMAKMLPHLPVGQTITTDVDAIVEALTELRIAAGGSPPPAVVRRPEGTTAK